MPLPPVRISAPSAWASRTSATSGAIVKAAHKGTVVAAGRDWANHVGFDGALDRVYRRHAPIADPKAAQQSEKPWFPMGIVIDDGNGYYSVYTEIKDLLVKPGDKVKVGQPIGHMSKAEGMQMMRYRLVRMDGPMMRVHESARSRGYPLYARERVDPLVVLNTRAWVYRVTVSACVPKW